MFKNDNKIRPKGVRRHAKVLLHETIQTDNAILIQNKLTAIAQKQS